MLSISNNKKSKNEDDKQCQKIKGDNMVIFWYSPIIYWMIRKLIKLHTTKCLLLIMGNALMNALEDAYNTLVNIKKWRQVKVVNMNEFHELKSNEKTSKEIKEGKEDKFMKMVKNNKTWKIPFKCCYEKKLSLIPTKNQVKLINTMKKTIQHY